MEKKLLYLTGFMGAGKSTVGSLLAKKIAWKFVDLDATIEQNMKQPICLIFEQKGESFFRSIEKKMLQQISTRKNAVVATGGGTVIDKENREIMHNSGLIIWLKWHPDSLLKNAKKEALLRPLLKDKNSFTKLYHKRLNFYKNADITIACDRLTKQEIIKNILQSITEYNIIDCNEILDSL